MPKGPAGEQRRWTVQVGHVPARRHPTDLAEDTTCQDARRPPISAVLVGLITFLAAAIGATSARCGPDVRTARRGRHHSHAPRSGPVPVRAGSAVMQ